MRRKQDIDLYPEGKVPPQAIEFEEAVISAIMFSSNAFMVGNAVLTAERFYKPEHQIIFSACKTLFDKGEPIDLLTVTSQLRKTGQLENAGGFGGVTAISGKATSNANIEYHARIITEKYIQREIIQLGNELLKRGFDETEDALTLLIESQRKLESITGQQVRSEKTSLEVLKEVVKEISDLKDGNRQNGIKYGHSDVDANVPDGMTGGELIILAARPGMGKSAEATNIAINAAVEQGEPGAIFNLEMKNTRTMRRMLSQHSGLHQKGVKRGDFLEDNRFNQTIAKLEKAVIIFDEETNLDIHTLRAKCIMYKKKYGIKWIIIDYLQLMKATDKRMDAYARVSEISRGCKLLAKELDIPVILLSQLSREVDKRTDKRPVLSDLRDSGCLLGDTRILCQQENKVVRIEDFVGRREFPILSHMEERNNILTASKCWNTGIKEVFDVVLINGQSIKATANHKFLTDTGWKPVSELIGEKIAIPVGYGFEPKEEIRKSEARFIGHFICNGSVDKRQPLRYACNLNDEDLAIQVIKDAVDCTLGGVIPEHKKTLTEKGGWITVTFKSRKKVTHGVTNPAIDLIKKHGLYGVKSKQKHIPEKFFFQKEDVKIELLKALFSGDGTAYYSRKGSRKTLTLSYGTSSIRLANDIQELLLSIGVVSFRTNLKNANSNEWYNISISGKSNIKMFVSKVGFLSSRKNKIMFDGWNEIKSTRSGWNKYLFNENRTLCFMPVKSITSIGEHPVYDIEVPESHNFVANGILAHNSIEQDADVVWFIYRPHYYKVNGEPLHDDPTYAEFICAKFREGEPFMVPLKWDGDTMNFSDWNTNPFQSRNYYEPNN